MVLVTYKRVYYISDEDPTLAKVSSDLLHHSCLMARDGQGMHDGDEVPAVVVADRILFPSCSRSHIKDNSCPLDGVLGKDQICRSVLKDIRCPSDCFAGERSTLNEGLQDFLLPPDLENTTALSLVS